MFGRESGPCLCDDTACPSCGPAQGYPVGYTDEAFDQALSAMVDENPAHVLLAIAGVYELVAEEFNNAVMDRLSEAREGP